MIVKTENSTYELDKEGKRIRRLEGVNEPTPHFAPDGEWKTYDHVSDTWWGGLAVFWPDGKVSVTSTAQP